MAVAMRFGGVPLEEEGEEEGGVVGECQEDGDGEEEEEGFVAVVLVAADDDDAVSLSRSSDRMRRFAWYVAAVSATKLSGSVIVGSSGVMDLEPESARRCMSVVTT